ncbi:MAG: DMT family transporter [Parachlamydiales bacterium]|jgi:drug/metabolite transporter (DMT)-like permease
MNSEKKGLFFALLAALSYATYSVFVKLAVEVPPLSMVFFRNLTCLMLLAPMFLRARVSYKSERLPLFGVRALMGFLGLCCFYFATKRLLLVDAVMLINTSPLFVPLVILVWDRVKIPPVRLLSLMVGFFGVLCILKPNFNFINFAGLVGLGAGIFVSVSYVILKKLSKTEPATRILFYFFAGNTALALVPTLFELKQFQNPYTWLYLFLVGLTSFFYQVLATRAYTFAPATKVSAISGNLAVVFSGLLGWLIWGKIPDLWSFIGIALVIFAGITVAAERKTFSKEKAESA